jgi:thiamine biosynthesis lipoprotein
MPKRLIKNYLLILLIISFTFNCLSCTNATVKKQDCISDTKFMLDTLCTISLYDKHDKAILEKAFELCEHYDNLLSMTVQTSDIYKINLADIKPITVNKDTIEVIKNAINYSIKSSDMFDITVGKLTALWDFDSKNPKVPSQEKIDEAKSTINYKKIIISGNTVKLTDKNTMIDLGAIAKGFIADKIKLFLQQNGVMKAIINLGGNIVVIGSKAKGTPWIVGIQQPFEDKNVVIGNVYVSDKSVVTSGIYERYFYQNGKLYMHILNPRTGYPIDNDLSSVTIISNKSVDGDGLSTTCFLLGVEKAEQLIKSLKDVEAIFITKENKIITTPGIGTKIKFVKANY